MAGPSRERLTEADMRHFDFVETLLRISDALTEEETANIKLFCMHLIPKGQAAQLRRAVDVFRKLIELDKIDQENLDFLEEILRRIGRQDLIRDVLRPFQPPDREIPENPELQPGTSIEDQEGSADGTTSSNTYVVVYGSPRMTQETLDRLRNNLASLCRTRRSQVKFRGYKKGGSILVHFSIPWENTAVLRHMAQHSDPRLVYMGVKSLQINAELRIEVTEATPLHYANRQHIVDDIEVGRSTPMEHPKVPKTWSSLSALNLFSDALPLHLQVAESLEYQGFSYSLVQALVQKDQEREHKMRQVIENLKQTEVDSDSFMTMRSKLTITENRLKEALETITVLEGELQEVREYAEKAAKQVASHVPEYTGEKPAGVWPAQVERVDVGTQTLQEGDERATLALIGVGETSKGELVAKSIGKSDVISGPDGAKDEKKDVALTEVTKQKTSQPSGHEGAPGDVIGHKITYGGKGSQPGKFEGPRGVVVSPTNEIFVADSENSRVQVHSIDGVYLRQFPTVVPGTGHKVMMPDDVSMDGTGTLWVVGDEESAHHVVQYSKDGTAMTQFDLPKTRYARGIAVDMRNNHIMVTETDGHHGEVQVFRPDGSLVRRFGHPESEMRRPWYITVGGEGRIIVSDWYNDFVYIYDEFGKLLVKFGGSGSADGQLKYPRGICADRSGHIILADSYNDRVQIFPGEGEYVRHIDTLPWPEGVALGPEGHLVVTHYFDHEVTIFPSYA